MKNYWINKRDKTWKRQWIRQHRLMCDEIAEKLLNGLDPYDIDFKALYAKYPEVTIGARKLLVYVQKNYGIKT